MPNLTFLDDHVPLPTGRLLYAPGDGQPFVVVRRAHPGELWIAPAGWDVTSEAAGPFRPDDALRALRLAGVSVPEGCERGPWTRGLRLFDPTPLPGHPDEWSPVEPSHLPPTLSRYHVVDIDGGGGQACCSPARHPPPVEWRDPDDDAALLALSKELHPDLAATRVGLLARAWNAHPARSPVLADRRDLARGFIVVDRDPA